MMDSGFYIKQLKLSGNGPEPAIIIFKKGLNIISGPTGTGKSYIFQCLNYMLGSKTKPKPITEAKGYDSVSLTIVSSGETEYTLESDLKGGSFILSSPGFAGKRTLARKHKSDDTENISAFLLELNNLSGKKVRKNAKGKTRTISYRDIARFILVDENRIITDSSPIVSGQYTTATEEKSTFKLILTGNDDSDIVESLSKDEVKYRNGKIHLLTDLITEQADELKNLPDTLNAEERILKIEQALENTSSMHSDLKNVFVELDADRKDISNQLSGLNSDRIYNQELLKRSEILKNQYFVDSQRLNSTIEASFLLENTDNLSTCPVCYKPMEGNEYNENISMIVNACNAEILKIKKLVSELTSAETLLIGENKKIDTEITQLKEKLDRVTINLEEGVGKEMEKLFKQISELNEIRTGLTKAIFINEKISSFQSQRESLSRSVSQKGENIFEDILTSQITSLSTVLEMVLKGIGYSDEPTVTFSESKNDFVISGEDRELAGKGLRAITYASFLIALQELVIEKPYSIGPCIMDSPLVTYKKPKADNEHITVDLAMDFYRYVADNSLLQQTIILENEEPPEDIHDQINLITFTKQSNVGRYGFIPVP